ncbi:hypothetical protein [Staphylococcus aureus]|uniref:hypothetical protein n=1 Tax=Staphylococcus aureus TaxID=1280 RepID=UPI00404994F8
MWFISIIILIAFLIILMIDDLIKTEQLHAKQYELDVIEKGVPRNTQFIEDNYYSAKQ